MSDLQSELIEKYAVEHRLPVMSPSWITAAHALWLSGDEIDMAAEQEEHRLPAFLGLKIVISGIENSTCSAYRKRRPHSIQSRGENRSLRLSTVTAGCTPKTLIDRVPISSLQRSLRTQNHLKRSSGH